MVCRRGGLTPHDVTEYRVIAPDLRGFGGSAKPVGLAAYSAPALVGDVTGLLDVLGIERAHLVGHDWGAAVAWWTAALVPDRVVSVTALSVGHPASFRSAGWRQREKSWSMLLFQFVGLAERWLPLDAPGKVNALLLDFLGQQGEISRSIR